METKSGYKYIFFKRLLNEEKGRENEKKLCTDHVYLYIGDFYSLVFSNIHNISIIYMLIENFKSGTTDQSLGYFSHSIPDTWSNKNYQNHSILMPRQYDQQIRYYYNYLFQELIS